MAPILFALVGARALGACGGEITIAEPELSRSWPGGMVAGDPPLRPGGTETELPAPSTRAARLSHAQWENSVRDLFRLASDTAFSKMLRSDPVQSGFMFDNNSLTFAVDDALFNGYQRAAGQVAEFVTSDATRLSQLAPASAALTDPEQRARKFVEDVGLRAHRRPLLAQEVEEYLALFRMGPSLYDGMASFEAGARVVIEAMLQSPLFVYRIEQSSDAQAGVVPLTSYEIASRLSYTLWNTMPDDALFAAAATDRLRDPAEAAQQAQRMLLEPRALAVAQHFHDQLFEVPRFESIKPSPAFFAGLPADFGAALATENRRFLGETVFAGQGGYATLLTSNETFVNADLAKIYGVPGSFTSAFTKVSLDPTQRRGVFTHLGFLALNATSVNPDPIHRGVFLAKRFLCATISAPPAMVPPVPEPMGRTNRETVEEHTQTAGTICANCHATLINPLGFPFENYDAIGRFRTLDNNRPVNASSDPLIGSQKVHVNNALELAQALATNAAAHRCYAEHWLEFAYGRPHAVEDAGLVVKLAARSLDEQLPIKQVLTTLVTTPAFLNRSAKELP